MKSAVIIFLVISMSGKCILINTKLCMSIIHVFLLFRYYHNGECNENIYSTNHILKYLKQTVKKCKIVYTIEIATGLKSRPEAHMHNIAYTSASLSERANYWEICLESILVIVNRNIFWTKRNQLYSANTSKCFYLTMNDRVPVLPDIWARLEVRPSRRIMARCNLKTGVDCLWRKLILIKATI